MSSTKSDGSDSDSESDSFLAMSRRLKLFKVPGNLWAVHSAEEEGTGAGEKGAGAGAGAGAGYVRKPETRVAHSEMVNPRRDLRMMQVQHRSIKARIVEIQDSMLTMQVAIYETRAKIMGIHNSIDTLLVMSDTLGSERDLLARSISTLNKGRSALLDRILDRDAKQVKRDCQVVRKWDAEIFKDLKKFEDMTERMGAMHLEIATVRRQLATFDRKEVDLVCNLNSLRVQLDAFKQEEADLASNIRELHALSAVVPLQMTAQLSEAEG